MNNLYNKIYNAVNEGVSKSLSHLQINDDENDKVTYQHSKANNYTDPLLSEFVDFGLPSGTLWGAYNIGAACKDTPESWYGGYYAWGETETKNEYIWGTYMHAKTEHEYLTSEEDTIYKYNEDDKLRQLEPKDDVAHIEYSNIDLFKYAKMPTERQAGELILYTIRQYVKDYNGIKGLNGKLCRSKVNDNFIFIPAGGYYSRYHTGEGCYLWTNTIRINEQWNVNDPWDAYYIYLGNDINGIDGTDGFLRKFGLPVRAVYNKNK